MSGPGRLNQKRRQRAKPTLAVPDPDYSNMKFTLNTGTEMPAVGFGTYRIRKEAEVFQAVEYALDAGYRMFDTAPLYGNEQHLKNAFQTLLPRYRLEREDIFITTKLSLSNNGKKTEAACRKSLESLGLEYVDLYLIHFPGLRFNDTKNKQLREDTWTSLEELYDEGMVNAIGVSNFTVRHLEEILTTNHSVIPAVNQVEWHPYYHQNELHAFCKANNIILQAYRSMGGSSIGNYALLEDPVVNRIATKLNVTCNQLLLVWALQQEIAVIPKSTNPERIKQNISLNFTIPEDDMKALDSLGEKEIKYAWDPNKVS